MHLGCSLPPSVCGYDTATLGTETEVKARAVQSTHLKVSFAVCALWMLPAWPSSHPPPSVPSFLYCCSPGWDAITVRARGSYVMSPRGPQAEVSPGVRRWGRVCGRASWGAAPGKSTRHACSLSPCGWIFSQTEITTGREPSESTGGYSIFWTVDLWTMRVWHWVKVPVPF